MKYRYTKYLLWFMLGAIISLVVYPRYFEKNIINNRQNLHHQAQIALHDEKYEHVIELCEQAIQADASSTNLYLMHVKKAKALNKLHRYAEAIESADSAVTIYPRKEDDYLVKVDPLFNLGREEELTAILEEIEAINPHTPFKPLLNALRLERGKAQYP